MVEEIDLELLEKIGMTEGEVKVYLSLLELGNSSTGKIIDKSQITSSKVYLILERLEQKGLVSHVIKNNVKYFQVADPVRLKTYMEKKKQDLERDSEEIAKMIPLLQEKRNSFELSETTMYHGFDGFKFALEEFISDLKEGDEYLIFGAKEHFGKKFENFIKYFYINKEKRGIKTRLIYNSGFREVKKLYAGLKLTNVRFIDYITPSTIALGKDKILITAYGDNPIQVLITNKALCDSFKQFFESMWRIAKN